MADEINNLRHVIRPGKLETDNTTALAVNKLKDTANETEFRSFLRLRSVFRRLMSNFSHVAALLNKKLFKIKATQFQTPMAPEKTP